MKFYHSFWSALAGLVLVCAAHATIHTVSPLGTADYTTIQAAFNASVSGDTVLIAPATYNESITINNRRLNVIGAGWDLVTVLGIFNITGSASSNSIVEGLHVETGFSPLTVQSGVDSVIVRRCLLRSTQNTVISLSCPHIFIEDCLSIEDANGPHVAVGTGVADVVVRGSILVNTAAAPGTNATVSTGNNGGPVEFYNCTMLNFNRAFNLTGTSPLIAINDVFYDWSAAPIWGSYVAGSVIDYVAAGGGSPSFPADFTNTIALGTNNPFVNYDPANNYQLGSCDLHLNTGAGGAALADAGNPLILDLDSTRSDIGAYGGQRPQVDNGVPAFPFTVSLSVPNLIESDDSLHVTSAGRIGPRY